MNKRVPRLSSRGNNPCWENIHKSIIAVCYYKFEDGYYADAIESAFKEINVRIKEIYKAASGTELDGKDLMFKALADPNPIIRMGDLSTTTGRNMQEGYRFIFGGAMLAIRNPKAHTNINIDKNRAIHFLYLASLLMYKLDEKL